MIIKEPRLIYHGSAVLSNGTRCLYVYYPGLTAWVRTSSPFQYRDRDYRPTVASLKRIQRLLMATPLRGEK